MVNIVLAIEEAGNNTVAKLIRVQHQLKKIKLITVQANFKSDLLKEAVINHQDTIVDYDVDGFGSLIQVVPSFKNLRSSVDYNNVNGNKLFDVLTKTQLVGLKVMKFDNLMTVSNASFNTLRRNWKGATPFLIKFSREWDNCMDTLQLVKRLKKYQKLGFLDYVLRDEFF
nr:1951_t:CDS:2 [Entrophospora candida]